jgi:hypothetical protein
MKHAWGDVADGFARLGGAVRQRYHAEVGDEGEQHEEHGEREPRKPPPQPVAAIDALRDALDGLVAAGRDVGQRALDVWRDPDVNAEAKHAAASLNEALSATVDMIGREVSSLFTGRRGQGDPQQMPDEVVPAAARDDEVEATLEAGGEQVADSDGRPRPPDVEGPNSA